MTRFFGPNYSRSHDGLYLNSSPSDEPKHSFLRGAQLIQDFHKAELGQVRILDIGCAVGHFPNYLQSRFPQSQIEGLEFVPELVARAKTDFPNLSVTQGSVLDKSSFDESEFDTITLMGVLQIFDDPAPALENIFYWLKKSHSQAVIHGLFNPYDLDVFIRYKPSGPTNPIQIGWNIHSISSIRDHAKRVGFSEVKFHKFELPFELAPTEGDPLRSWTERTASGERFLTNGLNIVQPQFLAELLID